MSVGIPRDEIENGGFYRPVGVLSNDALDKVAKSEEFAKELWDWTQAALNEH
jgi:hypothetical protein